MTDNDLLNLEYLTVKCRPFYLPCEFTVVIVTVVYIPLDANASLVLCHLVVKNTQAKDPLAKQHRGKAAGVLGPWLC